MWMLGTLSHLLNLTRVVECKLSEKEGAPTLHRHARVGNGYGLGF